MAAGLAVGSVLMTLVMIPLNLVFTGILWAPVLRRSSKCSFPR